MDEVIKGMRKRQRWTGTINGALAQWSPLAFWTFVDESTAPVWSFSLFFYLTVVDLDRTQIKEKVTARRPVCILEEADARNEQILPWFRIETLTLFDPMAYQQPKSCIMRIKAVVSYYVTTELKAESYQSGCSLSSVKQRLMVSLNGQTFELA